MDFSEKYIKMCERAQEIQNKYFEGYDDGDYFYYPGINDNHNYDPKYVRCNINNGIPLDHSKSRITITYNWWLPRQDQLQDMIKDNLFSLHKTVQGTYKILLYNENEFIDTQKMLLKKFFIGEFDTPEKCYLSFIMQEKYNKVWNEEEQNWIKE